MTIAGILDQFSFYAFARECNFVNLNSLASTASLMEIDVELFFVESAWYGDDNSWRGEVSKPSIKLEELVFKCRSIGIPTLFWCREDPIHFDRFLLAASLFDYVFTTDINCIPKYKKALGHSRIFLLPFACQPRLHNPLEINKRLSRISFAGSYYKRFSDRMIDTKNIIDACASIMPIDIYDRYLSSGDNNYCFPNEFQKWIKGSLSNDEIDIAYKGYKYGINLNTVKDSESMFARRVPELLGSGTVIVSNSSRAFLPLFGEIIIAGDDPVDICSRLSVIGSNDLLRAKLVLAGVRKVMREHTYAHRLARIKEKVFGVIEYPALSSILVVFVARNVTEAKQLFKMLASQTHNNWKAICLVNSELMRSNLISSGLDLRIQVMASPDRSRTSESNLGMDASWIAVMDPSDYYGPNYLLDLILATRYSNASAFGKKQFFQVIDNNIDLQGSEGAYRPMTTMELRSSLISVEHFSGLTISQLFSDHAISSIEVSDGMALDYLSYCRNVFNQNNVSVQQVSAIVDDLEINQGSSIDDLYAKADALKMAVPFWLGKPGWKPEKLALIFGDRFTRDITGSIDRFGWHIISEMRDGDTCDLFSEFAVPIEDLGGKSGIPFYMEAGVGLQMQLLVRFELSSGALLDEVVFEVNTQNQLTPPDSCTHIRLGYRITSSGSSRITRLVLA